MPPASFPSRETLPHARQRYVRAVGPRLRVVLTGVFALAVLLGLSALYLSGITFLGWLRGVSYQNYFYLWMFLAHLSLGLLLIVPFCIFAAGHLYNARNRPNRRAVRAGYALLGMATVLLLSGLALVRVGPITLKNPIVRAMFYWMHVAAPLAIVWLYILHRLAGPRLRWRAAARWSVVAAALVGVMVWLNFRDPRQWNVAGPKDGQRYFLPSLARTAGGNFIPAQSLMLDRYCIECHTDAYGGWFHSAHHFSSFNNPFYLFSVRETRQVALKRDGNVRAARWCAGCHDPAPFFSGAFDDPQFDDVRAPTAQAGISCTACHAITHLNSTRGNADYTIEEPIVYPFTFSQSRVLQFINHQLIKAKPEFHKQVFLKPLHKSAEFCSACHKVSIPGELNHYKEFLRGQNHYDTFLLSGASGHGARSFYYPDHAKDNCASCHMPPLRSEDFAARALDTTHPGERMIHNHLFPAANTALPFLRGDAETVRIEQAFLRDSIRVDLLGLKEGGTIDGELQILRPMVPILKPGRDYLIEVVVRTLKLGHPLTQGTVDSNEIWIEFTARESDRVVAQSGNIRADGSVDPAAHFLNVYMLDRDGNRIDRRNVQDIFTPLYDHQIPPGAARVAHYRLHVPQTQRIPLRLDVKVNYRKFDAAFVNYVKGSRTINDLPVSTLAEDSIQFPVAPADGPQNAASRIPAWQRWNDYGIALLLEGDRASEKGELRQAAGAFSQVETLGHSDGPLNLSRVYFKEGRLPEAAAALRRAAVFDPPPSRWTLAWLSGQVAQQNGQLDAAIADFQSILDDRYPELDQRGFDFRKDYEVLNALGMTFYERGKIEPANSTARRTFLRNARQRFEQTLALDAENLAAHYALSLIDDDLGDVESAGKHRAEHERYRPDDNARDRAIQLARQRDKAADHAAAAVAIYELHP